MRRARKALEILFCSFISTFTPHFLYGFYVDFSFDYDVFPIINELISRGKKVIVRVSDCKEKSKILTVFPKMRIRIISNSNNLISRTKLFVFFAQCKVVLLNNIVPARPLPKRRYVYINHFYGAKTMWGTWVDSIDSLKPYHLAPSFESEKYWLSRLPDISKRLLIGNLPRIQTLHLSRKQPDYSFIRNALSINNDQSVALCCFSWRRSQLDSLFPFPVSEGELKSLNLILERFKTILIVKVHHVHDHISLPNSFSNIRFYKNDDLALLGLNIYNLLGVSNCLVTDYSSISSDASSILLPTAYYLDSWPFVQKEENRFPDEIPLEEKYPGPRIHSLGDLEAFVVNPDVELYFEMMKKKRDRIFYDQDFENATTNLVNQII